MAVTFSAEPSGRFAEVPRFGLFTDEHDQLRSAVRAWVERELAPNAEAWERAPVDSRLQRAEQAQGEERYNVWRCDPQLPTLPTTTADYFPLCLRFSCRSVPSPVPSGSVRSVSEIRPAG